MSRHFLSTAFCAVAISAAVMMPFFVSAGGISLGGTRLIYPAAAKQMSMSVRNTDEQSSYLVQSWVERGDGQKSQDFVVTPPLYVSGPGNENILRVMYVGPPPPKDQEKLYYLNTKSVPSLDKKEIEGKNFLLLAAVTRIKLLFRPEGLMPSVDKAPAELTFNRDGNKIKINNPTPYYITLAQIKIGDRKLNDSMVSPHSSISLPLIGAAGNSVAFRTINDYGAVTPERHAVLK